MNLGNDDINEIKVIFHVHLPEDIEKNSNPAVLGDVKELGSWEKPIVILHQPLPQSPTYWRSDPVIFSLQNSNEVKNIQYRYAIHISKFTFRGKDERIAFEGNSNKDNRTLDITRSEQFDIWKNNYNMPDKYRISNNNLRNFAFVDHIFNTIENNNVKDKVMDYQHLLNHYKELTVRASNLKFILNRVDDKSREKRLFLCFLLGYFITWQDAFYELPNQFPSALLLKALDGYELEVLPSGAKGHMYTAILYLVQNNAFQMKFDWLVIFTIAAEVDPNYDFIERLRALKYNKNLLVKFIKEAKMITPYICDMEFETYVKLAKWLIQLCDNMGSLFKLWDDVLLHNNKFDERVSNCFTRQVRANIFHDEAVVLEYNYRNLAKNCRVRVSDVFRDQVIFLLGSPNSKWASENIDAIKKLLHDNNLNWQRDEVIQSLMLISQSHTLELLNIFPEILDGWFRSDFSDTKEKKIPKICVIWFKNLLLKLDTNTSNKKSSNESNFIFSVFKQLELLDPWLGQRINLWRVLTAIAIDRVKNCSEEQIFAATKLIVQIKQDNVKELFLEMVKDILNKATQLSHDLLLNKIRIICDCRTTKTLQIPNMMSEDVLYHIMTRLQSQSTASNTSEHYLNILKASSFWNIILRASGSVAKLNSNPFVRNIIMSINELAGLLRGKAIDIQLLQQILEYDDEYLFRHFDAAVAKQKTLGDVIVSRDDIAKLRETCNIYQIQIDALSKFYSGFCPTEKVTDVADYIRDVKQRLQNLDKIKMKQLYYWTFHEKTLDCARCCYKFHQSQIFRNIFEACINEDTAATKVEYIAQKLIPNVFEKYDAICKQLEEWEKLKCLDAFLIWKNVENINAELDLMGYKKHQRQELMQTLDRLLKTPNWIEKLEELENVMEIFQVPHHDDDFLPKSIRVLKEIELGQVTNFFDCPDRKLSNINQDCWELIRALSNSDDFIRFFKEISKHDIKNLVNGIDEVQEDVVSLHIHIRQFLFPLMNNEIGDIDSLLIALLNIVEKNSTLGEMIALFNSSNVALRSMYSNIKYHHDISEQIKNIILNGTYIFTCDEKDDECFVSLKCTYKTNVVIYNVNEILDLREQAFSVTNEEFVIQVNIAQEIINIMSSLIQIGHFNYRKFEKELQGTDNMRNYQKFLKDELKKWEDIVDHAQEKCYYLTFFTIRQILAFYDYFTSENLNKENEEECKKMVSFVNNRAQLPSFKNVQGILRKFKGHLEILCGIGKELEKIFRNIPKQSRKLEDIEQHNIITKGRLFVAAYTNKTQVSNVIMSLYANYGCCPEPWQIMICTSSTTMEELSIFVKRSFFASDNGYNNHLFCMVNLELLNFKLQYILVNYIRAMQLKYASENYLLALLCCQKTERSSYILDYYLEFQEINELDVEKLQEVYQESFSNITCVSSDLSGQGKTEWIKEVSFSKQKIPLSFLISDNMDLNYLVNKLKTCKLKQIQSLHINILSSDYPEDVNLFLFELLVFKLVSYNKTIVPIPEIPIFIEISSSAKQNLLNCLPILKFTHHKHLSWNIKDFRVSQEVTSSIQVVCQFLKLYDLGKIDIKEIFVQAPESIEDPLSEEICQYLIMKYFLDDGENDIIISSFKYIENFVNILSDQLIRLSSSQYFTISNLKLNLKEANIRSTIIKSLLSTSKDIIIQSIKTKSTQFKFSTPKYEFDNSSNYILFFDSQTSNSFSVLYQDKNKVPDNIKLLLKSQVPVSPENWELSDYNAMTSNEHLLKLEALARSSNKKLNLPEYALSIDNLTKMALILLRVRANVPVVICGETGCGKTSLITYLAMIVEVQFYTLNIHAGIDEKSIMIFMNDVLKKAENGETWILFDEINTCNHLGLFADLLSDRKFKDKPIHPNVHLFATCNPYRLRTRFQNEVNKDKRLDESQINLVYQVKPLPDQILDYVWDLGIIKPNDECKYIQIMVEKEVKNNLAHPVFIELLFASQKFIRKVEEPYSVSLRDIKRAITFVKFFYNSLENRPTYRKGHKYPPSGNPTIMTRSFVLALSLCYHSRLYKQDLRKQYRHEMEQILQNHEMYTGENMFSKIIREEQEDYINRMQCPPHVAKNEVLLENVLSMIVCSLTRIPVFIIGESGTSKSLAVRLIISNLRGSDSNDEYFKSLPQVYLIPYQGSIFSTSDGVIKVFDKAIRYQETSAKQSPVVSVVLLENIELAEASPFNPLKVLHSLLEPNFTAIGSTVSIIGISSRCLDVSKNSRALLVQRPQFDLDDLVNSVLNTKIIWPGEKNALECLAKAYLDYAGQTSLSFHGLRDYYALVKQISLNEMTPENIQIALARNFGGTKNNIKLCEKYFDDFVKMFNSQYPLFYKQIPTDQLVDSNLNCHDGRHLMIIGEGDSVVNLLTYQLRSLDPVLIFGSWFPDDQSDYSNILRKIMNYVEAGRLLILTDLEMIYGNLYNLWDQNYNTTRSTGYFTRVAFGACTSPMLYVSPSFKCIIVMNENNLDSADSSLLNRFEKQRMSINDLLTDRQKLLVDYLNNWVKQMSSTLVRVNSATQFCNNFVQKDLFVGFNENETLQSLVINIIKNNPEANDDTILEKCKKCLIAIASPEGIIRSELSTLERDEINKWKHVYFYQQRHDSLYDYFSALLSDQEKSLADPKGHLIIVNTFSKINTDINSCLKDFLGYQLYNLSVFRTETQFSDLVKKFFFESSDQILFFQCDIIAINVKRIKLVKYIIEQLRNEYFTKHNGPTKHVCIILHIRRGCESITSNFICDWSQVFIESLESPEIPLVNFLDKSLYDISNSILFERVVNSTMPFEKLLHDELLWCLSCIGYQPSDEYYKNYISALNNQILNNSNFVGYIKTKTLEWILRNCQNWQCEVALNKENLSKFNCFSLTLKNSVRIIIKQTIAKILYSLEKLSATSTFFNNENRGEFDERKELSDLWKRFFMDNTIINIDNLCEPKPSVYKIPYLINDLEFPFSYYFMNLINYYEKYYYEELDILKQVSENVDDELYEDHVEDFKNNLISIHPNFEYLQKYSEFYYSDFIRIILSSCSIKLTSEKNLDFILRHLIGATEDKIIDPFILHIYWWKHSDEILIQLKLVETFPHIITKAQNDFIVHGKLGQYIFRESINSILQNICSDKPWKQDLDYILSILSVIEVTDNDLGKFSNLQLLFICDDLLKINSIPLEEIKKIIYLGKSGKKQEFITAEIINLVFSNLSDNIISSILFITKNLKLIPLESDTRLILYKNIFSKCTFKLMSGIIRKIFITELQQNKQIFFTFIKNPEEALQLSIRLKTINDSFKNIDSYKIELCSEIIQTIFNEFELNELLFYFKYSIESIITQQEDLSLQQITSIAFLKEFISKFWNNYFQKNDSLSKSIIQKINEVIKINHASIKFLQSYFVLNLYQQNSFDTKQLEILKKEFIWLEKFTDVESKNLSKLWKPIRKVNFEDFYTFCNNLVLDKYPFLSVFLKYYEKLRLIKYLYPIIRFVKILNFKLEHHLTRKEAESITFHEFIKKESSDDDEYASLKSLFEKFAFSWNSTINYIIQYQSKELPHNKPFLNLELPVIFGLIDQKDSGIYLYAIIDFLIQLHNEFLNNIKAIFANKCENLSWNSLISSIISKKVMYAQDNNFINYEWDNKIFKYSQRSMEVNDDRTNFIFDLQKIEMKLAKKLILNKVCFEMEDNQFYIKDFSFKYELFHNFPRILFDIKKILPQEPIPADKMLMTLAMFQPSNSLLILNNSLGSIDLSELLFHLEIILCFIKELSIKNNNIPILDFVNHWLKLESYNIKFIEGFSLKHIVVFYELIEEQVANSIIHDIDEKFKIPLTQQTKDLINNIMNYYDTENQNQQLIPAKVFAFALKRFIYRFLLIDSNIENLNLSIYLLDFTLNLWNDVEEELVEKLFPTCLLVSHAYNCYNFIVSEIEKTNERQNSTSTSTSRKTSTRIKKFKKFTG
ncbi:hypothetical protein RclHR1_05780009 [Rhizophagus clarus]|uniref:AAA+ ATPase domain-containing protein n=1 Tax=Rhizophagus clarus TaxID=94130 RepID=A0A2Z6RNM5_9GLOM|nr:hypothetical protein RclHR1_05780009 [Rhizophagus clarus]GES73763.1 hypothetical protein GLOIN_2v1847653 [Rhizophagus clarus]